MYSSHNALQKQASNLRCINTRYLSVIPERLPHLQRKTLHLRQTLRGGNMECFCLDVTGRKDQRGEKSLSLGLGNLTSHVKEAAGSKTRSESETTRKCSSLFAVSVTERFYFLLSNKLGVL